MVKKLPRIFAWLLFLLVAAYGIAWMTPLRPRLPGYHSLFYTPAAYWKECAAIRKESGALSGKKKADLLRAAVSDRLFPYWQGTRWGFNGTTQAPGCGQIACGYFVTTVLRDCGISLDRAGLAQLSSEEMIRRLADEKQIQRYSHVELNDFLSEVRRNGDQLYVVGLDTHTGFLVCEKEQCWFIHSSGSFPWCVVKEKAEDCYVLVKSNYRVTGCLTADEKFLERW